MNKTVSISTGIIADTPTSSGSIYPRSVLEKVIIDFNNRAVNRPSNGSSLNREDISDVSTTSHTTKRLYFNNSGVLCAEIEISDNEAGNTLLQKINSGQSVKARPIMCVPKFIADGKSTKTVESISSIVRVQVES